MGNGVRTTSKPAEEVLDSGASDWYNEDERGDN
jgi:hypothetical protein